MLTKGKRNFKGKSGNVSTNINGCHVPFIFIFSLAYLTYWVIG